MKQELSEEELAVLSLNKKVKNWKPMTPIKPKEDTLGTRPRFSKEMLKGFEPSYLSDQSNMYWLLGNQYHRMWFTERDNFIEKHLQGPKAVVETKNERVKQRNAKRATSFKKNEIIQSASIEDIANAITKLTGKTLDKTSGKWIDKSKKKRNKNEPIKKTDNKKDKDKKQDKGCGVNVVLGDQVFELQNRNCSYKCCNCDEEYEESEPDN